MKKFLWVVLTCLPLTSQAFTVFNNTDHDVYVVDDAGTWGNIWFSANFSNMVPAHQSKGCDSTSNGCYNDVHIIVGTDSSVTSTTAICAANKVTLAKGDDATFQIDIVTTKDKDGNTIPYYTFPNTGWCTVSVYR